MNKIIVSLIFLPIALLSFVGCDTQDVDNQIVLTSGIAKVGQALSTVDKLYQVGDTIVYKFEVTSPNGIEKIEFSSYEGVGINKKAPVVLRKIENPTGTTWTLVDTIKNIQNDVRYSLYVQDKNRQYKTIQVNAFLDISRYLTPISLFDGLSNGTSKTFINTESGRTFFIANTIGDPAGMDFGFAFLENKSNVLACLVSFDEYWKTAVYPSVVNNLNQPVQFRKSTAATSTNTSWIKAKVTNASDLKTIFDQAQSFSTVEPLLPDGKSAVNIKSKDVIAFKTADGRYGLMQVTLVDAKGNSTTNNQKISFGLVIEKKGTNIN